MITVQPAGAVTFYIRRSWWNALLAGNTKGI